MAGIFGGFKPDNTLGALFLTPPKGNEAHWRRKLANQGSISKARPSLGGRLENAAVSTLRKAGVGDKRAARLGSRVFAALNDLTPVGNATMAADAGQALGAGYPLQGLGLSALAVLPGAAGKIGKGMFGAPIRAYHASPYDFDKFSLSRIGSGEGAQAYGHGLYFAENRNVGDQYFQQFSEGGKKPARLYEVNLNSSPDSFLDWDAPLVGQSAKVREAVRGLNLPPLSPHDGMALAGGGTLRIQPGDLGPDQYFLEMGDNRFRLSPGDVKNLVGTGAEGRSAYQAATTKFGNQVAATNAFADLGIPGIRYFDQGSRTAGQGTRNYVVFDDSIIDILNKY